MKVEQIHHVTLIVDRLEEACDFYEQVLKLEPVNMVRWTFRLSSTKLANTSNSTSLNGTTRAPFAAMSVYRWTNSCRYFARPKRAA